LYQSSHHEKSCENNGVDVGDFNCGSQNLYLHYSMMERWSS